MSVAAESSILNNMDGAPDIPEKSLYRRDFVAWVETQAKAMRQGKLDAVDWVNVIEEIETLGRSERSALRSALANILEHLIKLEHSVERDPERGWRVTVATQRIHANDLLDDNPSLRRELPEFVAAAYRNARKAAMASFAEYEPARLAEYERSVPQDCPYRAEDIL